MQNITALNKKLREAGSNLSVFEDPYNSHRITILCFGRGCDITLARTKCTTAAQVERYIESNVEMLRASATRWSAFLNVADEFAAREKRWQLRFNHAESLAARLPLVPA
jgi:hypothetical protein